MQNSVRVARHHVAFYALALCACVANTVFAQDTPGVSGAPEEGEIAISDAGAGQAVDEAAATPEPGASGTVLDYEPSESISEDLSVSFPVDI
ncbi:MAG: hypothetical protein P8M73_08435 [Luminiphilus sp.]|jgi:hypothetical protein|nr:hypothetical protein [Luminiphilus sp.]